MTVKSKVIVLQSVTITSLNDNHIFEDDPINKTLKIKVNGTKQTPFAPVTFQVPLTISGAEYDAFYTKYGDGWTSANLNETIMAKLGLEQP